MPRTSPNLLPRVARLLAQFGEKLKLARRRRKFSAELVSARAGIARKTLYRVENGDPAVAIGIYARVLQVLRLELDLAKLAADDELGRKLQDAEITTRVGMPRLRPPRVAPPGEPKDRGGT